MINPAFRTPPAVKNLIIANSLIFLATYLIPSVNSLLGTYGQLFWIGSANFHAYQFISYMFLHGSFSHLFFNMFALWMFGRTLEYELSRVRGSRAAQPRAGAACGIQALASFFSKCGGGGGQGLEQMINDDLYKFVTAEPVSNIAPPAPSVAVFSVILLL